MAQYELRSGHVARSHMDYRFPTDNEWGIPLLQKEEIEPPTRLYGWRDMQGVGCEDGVHFYYDDSRFECIWNAPSRYVDCFRDVGCVFTPDWSLYTDWPLVAQLWNVYRNRWVGAYWQSQGLCVVPTMCWSTEESYAWCFAGVEPGSVVSVSTVGIVKSREGRRLWERGYAAMHEAVFPATCLVYGSLWYDPPGNVVRYPFVQRNIRGR